MNNYYHIDKSGLRREYFYDKWLKLWTVIKITSDGFLSNEEADYYQNKEQLLKAYPDFDFKKEKNVK